MISLLKRGNNDADAISVNKILRNTEIAGEEEYNGWKNKSDAIY